MSDRPIEPNEAFALGALHGILLRAGCTVDIDTGLVVSERKLDVFGLVPGMDVEPYTKPCMRITIEEVR